METVLSKDGTRIAFDKAGKGPALILVGGSFEQRRMDSETSQLAAHPLLRQNFTVFHYDRRGRGDSTDTQPFAVEREVEDIEALVAQAGGSAFVSGISTGAILAMEAAIRLGNRIKKLAMYEAPFNYSGSVTAAELKTFRTRHHEAVAEGRRDDAVACFLSLLGIAAEQLQEMRQLPVWPMWEAIAPTFAYDAALLGEDGSLPLARAAQITPPVLLISGEASGPAMHQTAAQLAGVIPQAQHRTLAGQTHQVAADALAPVLVEYFVNNKPY